MADYISQFTGSEIDSRLAKVPQIESALDGKQATLVSGTNIKTVNGESILGSGNITAGDPNAVKYVSQTLTEEQKAQARANIDAASLADIADMDFVTATTLPTASASTMGHIYLIGPDSNDNYDRYFTQESSGSYSWVSLGSTQIDLSDYATQEELSQLEAKVQELFLQELTGAAYATWNTSAGQTHYVIPVNGGEDVSFDNTAGAIYCAFLKSYSTPVSGATPDFCTGYSGRQSYAESDGFTIPTDCRFLIINNPNGNYSLSSLKIKGIEIANGVHGSISNIGDKLKQLDGNVRYITPFYPCFVARASSHDDVNMSVSSAGGTISAKNSTILKSFSELTLTGFDKTKPHFVSLFRNGFNGGTEYQIEFSKIDGNTITQVVRFYIPVAQITNAGGINHIDVTDGNYRIQAVIDFSSFPSGGAVTCRTIEYANFVVARHCFESVEEELAEVYDYVDESLADTVKDSDLHLATGVNLANPDNIDDGHYVSNSGTIAENADWSMISIPVTAGVKYTFGGFYLGRNGYYCFYNGTEIVGSAVLFSDPNGTQYPVTVTAPVGANKIIIDIKTGNSPTGAYSNLMVNVGETLAQYEPYKVEIDKIKGYPIMGSESGGGDINGLLANLPVSSDGSTIPSGYAYIEQSTGAIKVKMS